MEGQFTKISNSLADTDLIAGELVNTFENSGGLICLYGDIGAGKTALTTMVAKYLGIKEHVTSPSFVILNEYHSGTKDLYHFDLYRLEEEGVKSILDELQTYSELKNALTFVEWAEFSQDELPLNRLEINIKYLGDTQREFTFINKNIFDEEKFGYLKEALK